MKEWLSTQDIAELTGKDINKVREAVRNLRRANVIRVTRDSEDERQVLVYSGDIEIVKRALMADGNSASA